MPALPRLHLRPPIAAVAIGLVALLGATARAAPTVTAASGTLSAGPAQPPAPPPIAVPRGAADPRRMWAVSLSNMVVYENGSGYLYGTWRTLGGTGDQPARLYWGRGCPDISDRVYTLLQTGFSRQDTFFLVVDREPDPRQQGAFCVRGVELENRLSFSAPPPAPGLPPAPVQPTPGGK